MENELVQFIPLIIVIAVVWIVVKYLRYKINCLISLDFGNPSLSKVSLDIFLRISEPKDKKFFLIDAL